MVHFLDLGFAISRGNYPMIHLYPVKISDLRSLKKIESLAKKIWIEYYVPMVDRRLIRHLLMTHQSKEAIYNQIADGFLYYLIKQSGKVIGYTAILPRPRSRYLFLSKIYLLSSQRGKGVGRKVLMQLETMARGMGFCRIRLRVNKKNIKAIAVYKNMGFVIIEAFKQKIGKGYYLDDYRMEKRLGASRMKKGRSW